MFLLMITYFSRLYNIINIPKVWSTTIYEHSFGQCVLIVFKNGVHLSAVREDKTLAQ